MTSPAEHAATVRAAFTRVVPGHDGHPVISVGEDAQDAEFALDALVTLAARADKLERENRAIILGLPERARQLGWLDPPSARERGVLLADAKDALDKAAQSIEDAYGGPQFVPEESLEHEAATEARALLARIEELEGRA